MRYCIAKHLKENKEYPYIRISETLHYGWARTFEEALNVPLKSKDEYSPETLDELVAYLNRNNMNLILDYDEQSHPEYLL